MKELIRDVYCKKSKEKHGHSHGHGHGHVHDGKHEYIDSIDRAIDNLFMNNEMDEELIKFQKNNHI